MVEVAISAATAAATLLVTWAGRALYKNLRQEGATELRRLELNGVGAFQERLMTRLDTAEEDLDEAWGRLRECEERERTRSTELQALRDKVAHLQRRCELLEVENQALQDERRQGW